MSLLAIRFEQQLAEYLSDIEGITIYRGHNNGEQTQIPRMIVTVASGGGELINVAGVDELEVEIQIIADSGEAGVLSSLGDPVAYVGSICDQVRGMLQESVLDQVEAAFDTISFSGMEYTGHREGRDAEKSLHGIVMSYRAYAGLLD